MEPEPGNPQEVEGRECPLPGLDPALELLSDSGIGGFSHAAHQRCFKNHAAVLHSGSLEDMIARPVTARCALGRAVAFHCGRTRLANLDEADL